MSEPHHKRQRASTNGAAHPPPAVNFKSLLGSLPTGTIHNILIQAAQIHPDVANLITSECDRVAQIERAKVIEFDYLSKDAWKAVNVTYRGMSGSKQYNFSFEAVRTVEECIGEIESECSSHTSFGTKRNALETLRKIGKTICLSGNDTLGHEVQKSFQYTTTLEDTMKRIAEDMTQGERDLVMDTDGWSEKIHELLRLSKSYCVFEGLKEVVSLLDGKSSAEDSDDSDASDDDEAESNAEDESEEDGE